MGRQTEGRRDGWVDKGVPQRPGSPVTDSYTAQCIWQLCVMQLAFKLLLTKFCLVVVRL